MPSDARSERSRTPGVSESDRDECPMAAGASEVSGPIRGPDTIPLYHLQGAEERPAGRSSVTSDPSTWGLGPPGASTGRYYCTLLETSRCADEAIPCVPGRQRRPGSTEWSEGHASCACPSDPRKGTEQGLRARPLVRYRSYLLEVRHSGAALERRCTLVRRRVRIEG